MKVKKLFEMLSCVVCMQAGAQTSVQDYQPFAEEYKTWETQVGGIMENVYVNRILGDTIIRGETWKKVYNYVFPGSNLSYYAAVRDVGRKVYAIAKGSERPRLLYDFDLKKGSIIRCGMEGKAFGCLLDAGEDPDTLLGFPFVTYLKVERIETVIVCGVMRRRLTFTLLDAFKERMRMVESVCWIEGIGSGAGPFSPWMPLPRYDEPFSTYYVMCSIDKDFIGSSTDFRELETSSAAVIPKTTKRKDATYDLQGRQLLREPEHGICIKDGRKVISN